jgi:NAD dependent epimerase/dehydratase family enzyme
MSASERRIAALEEQLQERDGKISELRHLLKQQMRTGESLEVEAIVNLAGEPLVNLRWDDIAAQVSVEDAREFAMDIMRCAEWALVDSKVFKWALGEFGIDGAAAMMVMLREGRGGHRDMAAAGGDNV